MLERLCDRLGALGRDSRFSQVKQKLAYLVIYLESPVTSFPSVRAPSATLCDDGTRVVAEEIEQG